MKAQRDRRAIIPAPLALEARRLPSLLPAGPAAEVNFYKAGDQRSPAAAFGTDGRSIVVWQDAALDGSGSGIFAQRFGPGGVPAGVRFRVNANVLGAQVDPRVGYDASGRFVVSWKESGGTIDVFRRFNADGTPIGGPIRFTLTAPGAPNTLNGPVGYTLLVHPAGDFSLVDQAPIVGDRQIDRLTFAHFTADGVNDSLRTTLIQAQEANGQVSLRLDNLIPDALGNISVAWTDRYHYSAFPSGEPRVDSRVKLARFNADGARLGPDQVVAQQLGGPNPILPYINPVAVPLSDGSAVVAWTSIGPTAALLEGRRFDVYAQPVGGIVPLYTSALGSPDSIVRLANGRFAVAVRAVSPFQGSRLYFKEFDAQLRPTASLEALVDDRPEIIVAPVALAADPRVGLAVAWGVQEPGFQGDIVLRRYIEAGDASTLQFQDSAPTIAEKAGHATIVVTRAGGTAAAVAVRYATSNGSAQAGADYKATAGILISNPGETSKSIAVPILDDHSSEGEEAIVLTLSVPFGATLGGAGHRWVRGSRGQSEPPAGFGIAVRAA